MFIIIVLTSRNRFLIEKGIDAQLAKSNPNFIDKQVRLSRLHEPATESVEYISNSEIYIRSLIAVVFTRILPRASQIGFITHLHVLVLRPILIVFSRLSLCLSSDLR